MRWKKTLRLNFISFSLRAELLIVIIAGLLVGTGWYVWSVRNKANRAFDAAETASSSTVSYSKQNEGAMSAGTANSKSSGVKSGNGTSSSSIDYCKQDPDLCKYVANADISKWSHVMTADGTPSSSPGVKRVVYQWDGKGNSYVYSGLDDNKRMELIALDGFIYEKDASDGKWKKYKSDDPSAPSTYRPGTEVSVNHETYNYKKEGQISCGMLTCFEYKVTEKNLGGSTGTRTLLFDTSEYRLQSYLYEIPGYISSVVSVEYKPVTIKEPSPTKNP